MTVRSDAGPGRDRAFAPMPWANALAAQIGRQVVGQQRLVHRLTVEAPVPLTVAALAMIAEGLLAAYLPARRAARVEPVEALRQS